MAKAMCFLNQFIVENKEAKNSLLYVYRNWQLTPLTSTYGMTTRS